MNTRRHIHLAIGSVPGTTLVGVACGRQIESTDTAWKTNDVTCGKCEVTVAWAARRANERDALSSQPTPAVQVGTHTYGAERIYETDGGFGISPRPATSESGWADDRDPVALRADRQRIEDLCREMDLLVAALAALARTPIAEGALGSIQSLEITAHSSRLAGEMADVWIKIREVREKS